MRTGNITDATKILIMAAATIITCVIVWLGFSAMNLGRELSKNAMQQMTELSNEIADGEIMKYDTKSNIQGNEVVNFIKKYLGGYQEDEEGAIYISVFQNNVEFTYTNNAYISNIRNFTDVRFIDPTSVFSGEVIRNDNNVIMGVKFTKL